MKRLVCEMCGSTDLVKQDGVFVCQSCGCKYSVEETKKLMIEINGPIDVSGSTVKVDHSSMLDGYYKMAENALNANNNAEAENYANKIIEIDPRAYKAWLIKANAAGWQTTYSKNRFSESIQGWTNAAEFVPENERLKLASRIVREAYSVSVAIMQMKVDFFVKNCTKENEQDLEDSERMMFSQLICMKKKTGFDVITDDLRTHIAQIMFNGACKACDSVDQYYGTVHMNHEQWKDYVDAQDACQKLMGEAYLTSSEDNLSIQICQAYINLAEKVRDSCSYRFSNGTYVQDYYFTEDAKKTRNDSMDKYRKNLHRHNPMVRNKQYEEVLQLCDAQFKDNEEALANQQYWKAHVEEKADLEAELTSLKTQMKQKRQEEADHPLHTEKKECSKKIESLEQELSTLGLFKGKEKRALREQIDEEKEALSKIESELDIIRKNCDDDISQLNAKYDEINLELTKPHGRIPTPHGEIVHCFVPGKKDLLITPKEFVDFCNQHLPEVFKIKPDPEPLINNTETKYKLAVMMEQYISMTSKGKMKASYAWMADDPADLPEYRIDFIKNGEKNTSSVYFNAKSPSDPIERAIRFCMDRENTDDIVRLTTISSCLLFDMFPSLSLLDLQQFIAAMICRTCQCRELVADGIRISSYGNWLVISQK